MRVVFMGTSEFATPSLQALLDAGHRVVGVWTRMDKPRGRGHHLDASPVKQLAETRGLEVYQPRTLRNQEAGAEVAARTPDVICVAAYGLILPPDVLAIPRLGCVNVHASMLPRYRGAAPIQRAIMAGERETGITTMMMAEGLDTGDILLAESEALGPDDTYGEAHDRLAMRGAGLLLKTLELLERGECPRTPQDDALATYAPPIQKEECRLDWDRSAEALHNLTRGVHPRPGAFTVRAGEVLRIHRTRPLESETSAAPGSLAVPSGRRGLMAACGEGVLELLTVQPAGKKPMSGADYLLGRPIRPGERFGAEC